MSGKVTLIQPQEARKIFILCPHPHFDEMMTIDDDDDDERKKKTYPVTNRNQEEVTTCVESDP